MTPSRVYMAHVIVLKRANVGEADRIVTIFSKEYGRMRVVAKGIRRIHSRRSAHLEVFSHTLLVLHHGKTWDSVTEATPLHAFSRLRTNLSRVSAGYYLCELVDALLPERQEHRDIYSLLLGSLTALNDSLESDPVTVSEQFALEILRILGYLAHNRTIPSGKIEPYIESIVEKRIRSYRFLTKLAQ